jgi:hypothetical protein
MRQNSPERIALYPKDVALLLGRNIQSARRFMREIRQALEKCDHQILTLREFCAFVGIDEQEAREQLHRK